MNSKMFMCGVACAVVGRVLAPVAAVNGREPLWAVVVLVTLLLGWLGFTVASFVMEHD